MSWQQPNNYGYDGYDAYGGYNDQTYGSNTAGDNASYDMYGAGGNEANSGQPAPSNQYSAPPYYDPYQQQPQATAPPTSQGGPQFAGGAGRGPAAAAMMMNPNELMANPLVTDMAMQYGQNIMGQGKAEIQKNLDKYISIGQLKYYFAVDTNYVGKKLGILLFPFTRSDWSIKYSQEEPVQPKFDVNAPDLYIPSMAYTTYILIVGYILGLKNAFSPDLLAATASSSLVWLILELIVIYLTLTIMSINTSLTKWDIVSFSTYKYVGMIVVLIAGLVFQSKTAYYVCLGYVSSALAFFLLRTLKLRIEPEVIF